MSDIVLQPSSGTVFNDISTSIIVSMLSDGRRPVGVQFRVKPLKSGPLSLSINLTDYSNSRSYGSWTLGGNQWTAAAGSLDANGYKLISFTNNNPPAQLPSVGDTVGFTLAVAATGQWSLESAGFAVGRTVQAVVVPEASSVVSGILGAAVVVAVALFNRHKRK